MLCLRDERFVAEGRELADTRIDREVAVGDAAVRADSRGAESRLGVACEAQVLGSGPLELVAVQKTKFGGELTHQRRRRKIAVLWRLGGDFPSFWENFRLK